MQELNINHQSSTKDQSSEFFQQGLNICCFLLLLLLLLLQPEPCAHIYAACDAHLLGTDVVHAQVDIVLQLIKQGSHVTLTVHGIPMEQQQDSR
jgi:hypothetical protein